MNEQSGGSPRVSEEEMELARAAALLDEIVEARAEGHRDTLHGNSDDDLLGAVEELEGAIRSWRGHR